jgi:hypothetical protein
MDRVGRRTFLKLASATAAAGGLYKLGLVGLELLASPGKQPPGPSSDR